MADSDVNISAFLELKDKMSGGVKDAAKELDGLGTSAAKASAAVKEMSSKHTTAASSVVSDTTAMAEGYKRARDAAGRFADAAKDAGDAAKDSGSSAKTSGDSFYAAFLKANLTADAIKALAFKAYDLAKSFVTTGIELNKAFQETELRIAGSLKAFNLAPTMDAAVKDSRKAITTIQDMAARLPGETGEYLTVFAQGLPKLAEAGMTDIQKMAKFTSQYTAALYGSVDAAQAANDLFMMLSGTTGADVKTWQVLAAHIQMTSEAFNKLPIEERLSTIDAAIAKQAQGLGLAANMYASVYGEYQSLVDEITRLSTQTGFEELTDVYASINQYLKENKDDLVALTSILMDGAVVGAKILAGWFVIIQKVVQGIKTAIDFIGGKIKEVNALVSTLFVDVELLVGKTEEATTAQRRLNDEREAGHAADLRHQREMAKAAKDYERDMAAYDKREEKKATTRGELWFPELEKSMGLQGREIMGRLAPHVRKLAALAKTGGYSREQALSFLEAKGADRAIAEEMWRSVESQRRETAGAKRRKPRAPKATTPRVVQDFRYSKFNITQEFAEGFDPDRIAVAFASDLGRLGEMKTQAVYSPTFAV